MNVSRFMNLAAIFSLDLESQYKPSPELNGVNSIDEAARDESDISFER